MGSKLLLSTKLRRKKVEMIKLLSIVIAVLTVTTYKAAAEEGVYSIVQKLDHFNYSDTRTIETSYVLNTEFYKSGGPLFAYTSDKFSYGNKVAPQIVIFDKLVKEHNGATLVYYNRYVDYSGATLKNVQYFAVEQSLADLSYLIRTIKKMGNGLENAKVILVGAHISGSIATWFKKLYPDLVNGVWASSVPLVAKAGFPEFYEILGKSIKELGGDACYDRVQDSFAELELMLANNRTAEVKQMFNLCDAFDGGNDLDVSSLFSEIILTFTFYMQNTLTISKLCGYVTQQVSVAVAIAQNFAESYRNNKPCIDSSYRSYLDYIKGNNELPKFYLQCNQFGWFRTTTSANQPFGSKCPLSFFTTVCNDLFGDKYTVNDLENNIREFNDFHGGSDLNLENVYFTYGAYDPWRALGISDEDKATIIPAYENGDGFPLAGSDLPPQLEEAHKILSALVTQWLK